MFKFIKKFFDRIGEAIYQAKERDYANARRIKLPILKQFEPLLTSYPEVAEARARIIELNQSIRFLTGIEIQSHRGLTFTLGLLFFRQLTHQEERLFKEAIGNVSTKMTVVKTHSEE
jgi:hypothetical protein